MLIVDKRCSDASAVTNFRCHKLIAKEQISKKNSDMENFICNAVGRKIRYFKYRKYQNLWMNKSEPESESEKVEAIKMQFVCFMQNI